MSRRDFVESLSAFGESVLRQGRDADAAERFRERLSGEPESAASLSESMAGAIDGLAEAVDAALALLAGPATLRLEPEVSGRVRSALETLDRVVFLSEALEALPEASAAHPRLGERIDGLLTRITIDRPPPFLRLAPMNDWRREKRDALPENARYLFPWHDAWSDLPADVLSRLTLHWEAAMATRGDAIGVPPFRFEMMLAELDHDRPLMALLRREALLHATLQEIVRENLAVRLYALHLKAAAERPPMSIAERIGVAALFSDPDAADASPASAMVHALLTGVFLPDISSGDRMARFSKVETLLPDVPASDPVFQALERWQAEELDEDAFIARLEAFWEAELARAAGCFTAVGTRPSGERRRFGASTDARQGLLHRLMTAFKWSLGLAGASSMAAAAMLLIIHPTLPRFVEPPTRPAARLAGAPASASRNAASDGEASEPAAANESSVVPEGEMDAPPVVVSLFQTAATGPDAPPARRRPGGLEKLKIVSRLEEMDLADIRLVGIVLTASGRKALVEDSENRGFILKPGTPVGNRSGTVAEIRDDCVIVEETETDATGDAAVIRRIIRFPDAAHRP